MSAYNSTPFQQVVTQKLMCLYARDYSMYGKYPIWLAIESTVQHPTIVGLWRSTN